MFVINLSSIFLSETKRMQQLTAHIATVLFHRELKIITKNVNSRYQSNTLFFYNLPHNCIRLIYICK